MSKTRIDKQEIMLSDMSQCQPARVLSRKLEKEHWQLITYETKESSGTIVGAASFIEVPDLTLSLNLSGWYAIYVGYWNPDHAFDEGTIVKVKLTDDPCFYRIIEPQDYDCTKPAVIQEAFFKYADLSGQDIVIGKENGSPAKKAYIAYIKLVPLSPEEVADIQKERARKDTKLLVSDIDGISYLHYNEYRTREHILELVDRYRYSDVGKVIWAVNYGDTTNYPSDIATFWAGEDSRARLVEGIGTTPYIVGQTLAYNSLKELVSKDIIPQEVVAEHVHSMGLKFDIMFRLGVIGHLPPNRNENGFVARHPEFRQVLRSGTPVEKVSYAFPEVRAFMLSIIREATEKFDVDGINLCCLRGPHFTAYEKPLIDDFKQKYGLDARKVAPTDPRLFKVRATYMTEFVRQARQVLDEVGKDKGKHLELSIWASQTKQALWWLAGNKTPMEEGLDIKGWIKEGLLDSYISEIRVDKEVDQEDIELCRRHNCRFILCPGIWESTAGLKTVTEVWWTPKSGNGLDV